MNAESKDALSLKVRSKSMPLVNVLPRSPRFQKIRNNRSKNQEEMQNELLHNKQFFGLQNIKDQQAEEINTKIKLLAERSMKKLEERYETIDKWKQKYVPQTSVTLIRQKLSLDNNSINTQMEQKSRNFSQNKQMVAINTEGNKLFPIIIKKHITPTFPDRKQQGKRLQETLRERLQRNKKYYELKSTIIEKEINYFQEVNNFIAPQKKRQLQLRKLLIKAQKDKSNNRGLFYQKISLSDPKLKRNKNIRILLQKQKSQIKDQKQVVIKKIPSEIQHLKAKLMQQVIGATPQGWNTSQLDSPQQQYLS